MTTIPRGTKHVRTISGSFLYTGSDLETVNTALRPNSVTFVSLYPAMTFVTEDKGNCFAQFLLDEVMEHQWNPFAIPNYTLNIEQMPQHVVSGYKIGLAGTDTGSQAQVVLKLDIGSAMPGSWVWTIGYS